MASTLQPAQTLLPAVRKYMYRCEWGLARHGHKNGCHMVKGMEGARKEHALGLFCFWYVHASANKWGNACEFGLRLQGARHRQDGQWRLESSMLAANPLCTVFLARGNLMTPGRSTLCN